MAANIRQFLRLQTDTWLTTLRDTVATAIVDNVEYTALNVGGKSVGQRRSIPTAELAEALADVLTERNLGGDQQTNVKPRQTLAQFH